MSLTLGIRQVGPLCATDDHKCVSTEQTQIPANRMSGVIADIRGRGSYPAMVGGACDRM